MVIKSLLINYIKWAICFFFKIMEYQVNVNTSCARNSTFVKWHDGASMFGVRFAKEDPAEQVFITKR